MSNRKSDPLLVAGRIVVLIGQGLLAIGATAVAIALPVMLIFQGTITAEMREEFSDPNIVFPALAIAGVLLLALAIIVLAFLFLDYLRRIIDTVGDGDPFLPVNADRLTRMAWFTLAIQLLTIPAAGLALYIAKQFEDQSMTIDAGFEFGTIILIITLFILARVFRQGAAMRDDLEGTV